MSKKNAKPGIPVAKNDIIDVASRYMTLNRRGANFWACCPFHNEKTPSFSK